MLHSIFSTSLRRFRKDIFFTSINIFGLSLGIATAILLTAFILHESQYDKFHENESRLFKVISQFTDTEGRQSHSGISFGSVAPEIKKDIPEVEATTRIYVGGTIQIDHDDQKFKNQNIYYSDHDFFTLFSFKSLYGSSFNKAQFDAKGIVLNSKISSTIFGDSSPIGETIELEGETYQVLDVVEVPNQSHLQFDLIVSLETFEDLYDWSYHSGLEFHTYGLFKPNVNQAKVSEKIATLYNEQMEARFENFLNTANNYALPFKDIYLNSEEVNNNLNTGSISTIYILGVINLFVLLIAVFNYINLSSAQHEKRLKEIGVRKVLGATKTNLIKQFIGESILLSWASLLIGVLLVALSVDSFSRLMSIDIELLEMLSATNVIILVLSTTVLGFLAGIRPALLIARHEAQKVLKRDFLTQKNKFSLSKVLVTLQFVITMVLIANLVFLDRQMNFVKQQTLGFSKDQVLIVNNLSQALRKNYSSLSTEIKRNPNIISVGGAQSALGHGSSGQTVFREGESPNSAISIGEIRTVEGFIETYEIKIIAGRDFNPNITNDKGNFILNYSAAIKLFDSPEAALGNKIQIAGRKGTVIGVTEDFKFRNIKNQISPLALSQDTPYRMTLAIKLNANNIRASLQHIEASIMNIDPSYEMNSYFLDEYFADMLLKEERNASLISISGILAASIALIGLIALVGHNLNRKIKEIAIRKVLGAMFKQLFWTLSKEYYLVVIMANLISIPIVIITMDLWQRDFSTLQSNGQNWIIFTLLGLGSLALIILSIFSLVRRKININPSVILKDE